MSNKRHTKITSKLDTRDNEALRRNSEQPGSYSQHKTRGQNAKESSPIMSDYTEAFRKAKMLRATLLEAEQGDADAALARLCIRVTLYVSDQLISLILKDL